MPVLCRKAPKALQDTLDPDGDQKPRKPVKNSTTRGVFISTIKCLLRRDQTCSIPESDDARRWIATKYAAARDIEDRKRAQREEEHVRTHLAYFEQSMDPLPARALYNHKFSRMYNLPREVLLLIIHHLKDDMIGFFMFRRASRLFRHLASLHEFQSPPWPNRFYVFCRLCREPHDRPCWVLTLDDIRGLSWHTSGVNGIRYSEKALIRHLLGKDRLCKRCHMEKLHERPHLRWGECMFWKPRLKWNWSRCSGCREEHLFKLFSPKELRKNNETRVCIGREGHVRVCSHLSLTWADVERGMLRWRESPPSNRSSAQAMSRDIKR